MTDFYCGNSLLKNNDFVHIDLLPDKQDESLYEVLRVIDGVPLFWKDHYKRLLKSANLTGITLDLTELVFVQNLSKLISHCEIKTGNIRILITIESNIQDTYFYFVPHSYPGKNDYKKGVRIGLLEAERNKPQAKIIQQKLRTKANQLILQEGFHEVLLVNKYGFITEGSRSNVFFLKGNQFVSPPAKQVLEGITRSKVIKCIRQLNCVIEEKEISKESLHSFDASFITGTSPKVLPVRQIDRVHFDVNNILVRQLMIKLDEIINADIEQNRHAFRL